MRVYFLILFFVFGIFPGNILLVQTFAQVPNTYRMNENIHYIPRDDDAQQKLIEKYLSMGYGGFAANVSFNQYLTPEGMNSFKAFCEKAKANNMELWLYDEQGYPSGSAGGRVFMENEVWEAKGIFKKDTLVNEGEISYKMPPGKTIQVFALSEVDTVDLLQNVDENKLSWTAPAGQWKIVAFSKNTLYDHFQVSLSPNAPREKLSPRYPSLLIPEVTQSFIRTTHDEYVDYSGNDLGKYFVSTFTDEPSLMAVSFADEAWSVIPWARVLSDAVEQKYAYRPENKLIELFEDEGSTGQKIRYQYFKTVAELISNNYFKPIKDWCANHGTISGGHLLLEETMMAHVPLYGDIFACFRQMDAPGIDALSCLPENTPVHTPKMVSSAAELTGSARIMCEPCPVIDKRALGGKEPATEKVRGFMNIQLAGGVTDFNNYLKLSNASPEEKKEFNQYVGRIAEQLRGGHSVADVALLYPIESLWTKFIPEPMQVSGWDSVRGGNPKAIEVEQSFRNTARMLFRERWEYNIIDTKAIEDSKVESGQLVHGNLKWRLLILPNVNTLSRAACNKLFEFVKSGGYLVAIGDTPINSTENFPDQEIKATAEQLFELPNAMRVERLSDIKSKELLEASLEKDIRINNEKLPVRFAHRFINDQHVYFVYNDSDKAIDFDVSFRNIAAPVFLDPETGQTYKKGENPSIHLEPYKSAIVKSLK